MLFMSTCSPPIMNVWSPMLVDSLLVNCNTTLETIALTFLFYCTRVIEHIETCFEISKPCFGVSLQCWLIYNTAWLDMHLFQQPSLLIQCV